MKPSKDNKCDKCGQEIPNKCEHDFDSISCEGFGTMLTCKKCGHQENDD